MTILMINIDYSKISF